MSTIFIIAALLFQLVFLCLCWKNMWTKSKENDRKTKGTKLDISIFTHWKGKGIHGCALECLEPHLTGCLQWCTVPLKRNSAILANQALLCYRVMTLQQTKQNTISFCWFLWSHGNGVFTIRLSTEGSRLRLSRIHLVISPYICANLLQTLHPKFKHCEF